jgi:PhzF family phenazine biosynthesis protein
VTVALTGVRREIVRVDAFVGPGLAGNPAAVVLADEQLPPEERQAIATDLDLPATAFPDRDGEAWSLRWHGPREELAFCGHGTLAAAGVLLQRGLDDDGTLLFETRAGLLAAHADGGGVELDLPALPLVDTPVPTGLVAALGVDARRVVRGELDALVELESPAAVRAATPNLAALAALPLRGAILTAAGGDDGADVTSRFFCPAVGIDEDPATGSAHCLLGPWWATELGRDDLVCRQASPRGGLLRARVRGDRVRLGGDIRVQA